MSVGLSFLMGHSAKENPLFRPIFSLDSQHPLPSRPRHGKCRVLGRYCDMGLKD